MKKYQYSESKKLNKPRVAACIILLGWLLIKEPGTQDRDLFFEITSQIVPLLTYEQEYGNTDVDYASTYQVPEWFYEDEAEIPVNGDTVMVEQQEGRNANPSESNLTTGAELSQGSTVENGTDGGKITTLADGKNGTAYMRKQLKNPDFLLSNIFVVDSNTSMTKEELDLANLLDTDLTIENLKTLNGKEINNLQKENAVQPEKTKAGDNTQTEDTEKKEYKVLIYHTHASESFVDSREGKQEDTIVGVGDYLTEILEKEYGIAVYHDRTTYDVVDGVLDRSKAYEYSYNGVSQILKDYPSIEVVIDLHRDGVDEETHLVTEINGKKTAKIMFLNGVSRSNMNGEIAYLENPNRMTNLAFSFQMYLTGKEYFGDYVRKIYVRSLRYNLHVMPRAALIEVGAQNNTVQEEKNAMEPLAAILDKVLSKKE